VGVNGYHSNNKQEATYMEFKYKIEIAKLGENRVYVKLNSDKNAK
jgi:hypothetical protein